MRQYLDIPNLVLAIFYISNYPLLILIILEVACILHAVHARAFSIFSATSTHRMCAFRHTPY